MQNITYITRVPQSVGEQVFIPKILGAFKDPLKMFAMHKAINKEKLIPYLVH